MNGRELCLEKACKLSRACKLERVKLSRLYCTCKGGESLQPSGQKSSKRTTPKVVTDKCGTSKHQFQRNVVNLYCQMFKNLQKRPHQK